MNNIKDFSKRKKSEKKISMVTCYDYWSAQIIDATDIDCILVGDSLAMVMHGHPSTVHVDVDTIALHTAAVARGTSKFIIGDMPFLSYRKGLLDTMTAVEKIMKSGAHAIKLEGCSGHEEMIKHIVESGVPVMGHIGLTPQSIHQLGGFRVQGKDESTAQDLLSQAQILEKLGCFSVVLECVPSALAQKITESLSIATIGIGAGVATDGQVLVLQDLLGLNVGFKPKFLKRYFNGFEAVKGALEDFVQEVQSQKFPSEKESY